MKLLVVVLGISSVITAVLTVFQLSFEYYKDYEDLKDNFKIIENSYIGGLTTSLWEMNDAQIMQELKGMAVLPGIQMVEVILQDKVIYQSGALVTKNILKQEFDLMKNENNISTDLGRLVVYANLDRIKERVWFNAMIIFLKQFLKTLIVSFFLYYAFQKLFVRHLLSISDVLKSIDPKTSTYNFHLNRKKQSSPDELDYLVENLNTMKNNLQLASLEVVKLNQELEKKVEEKTETILKQQQQLEYASKMSALGQMAGGIAHEVNNPLTIIVLSSQCISDDLLSNIEERTVLDLQFTKKLADRIVKASTRVAKIIQALRFFSRTEDSDPAQLTDLETILNDTLELCNLTIKNANIELRIDPLPTENHFVCNPVQISQVILNLLNNSVDALEYQDEKWIHISITDANSHYLIRITNSGPRIPLDIQQKIMDPFFTTKDVGKGTGLGLSISKRFIENHGGTLKLDNQSLNTSFVITLPKTINV